MITVLLLALALNFQKYILAKMAKKAKQNKNGQNHWYLLLSPYCENKKVYIITVKDKKRESFHVTKFSSALAIVSSALAIVSSSLAIVFSSLAIVSSALAIVFFT